MTCYVAEYFPAMDLEEAFQLVGEFGGHQKRTIAVLTLLQVTLRLASFVDINHLG